MILKYKDKRGILMLSTRHDGETQKPRVIEDYNIGKMYVDVSDQMCFYTPLCTADYKMVHSPPFLYCDPNNVGKLMGLVQERRRENQAE